MKGLRLFKDIYLYRPLPRLVSEKGPNQAPGPAGSSLPVGYYVEYPRTLFMDSHLFVLAVIGPPEPGGTHTKTAVLYSAQMACWAGV